MMENKKRNVSGNKHMKSVQVYRRIGDDEPIGEIILFKHHKDAKKKMIADVERYFKQDFNTLKETVNEYNGLDIEEDKITFEIEWWEVFKQPILKGAI